MGADGAREPTSEVRLYCWFSLLCCQDHVAFPGAVSLRYYLLQRVRFSKTGRTMRPSLHCSEKIFCLPSTFYLKYPGARRTELRDEPVLTASASSSVDTLCFNFVLSEWTTVSGSKFKEKWCESPW